MQNDFFSLSRRRNEGGLRLGAFAREFFVYLYNLRNLWTGFSTRMFKRFGVIENSILKSCVFYRTLSEFIAWCNERNKELAMIKNRNSYVVALLGVAVVCGARDLPVEQLPAVVRDAAQKACPEGWIDEVSVETEHGKVVYEVELNLGTEDCELEIAEDGTLLKKEKADFSRSSSFWSFEKGKLGQAPSGWSVAETAGTGTPATWTIVADAEHAGKCVAITKNSNSGKTFNLLLADKTQYKNPEISVMVKAVAGKEDQGGGPVWRVIDANNYYVCRWNPLEDNLRVYYVKDGQRKQIASATVKADPAVWHRIEVEQEGAKIEVEFDGMEMIEVSDATFTEAGQVGLWVKADGESQFDQFGVEKK